ncbi:transport permease protein [Catellatospora sp. TT07R-123]|uniref:ABC transporter permease n=1 Tax=Catellatospora sp. TT07R-123 TaxID=2733863 RepID=UPI001B115684|nr:ABC transporter permease [Catellatospora sp. TT07R-123]GHJ45285.1 transport permease protein [Catellatospora sp. TT07R-123]
MGGTFAVLERHLTLYRRLWQASIFSSFVLPILFVISIGIGVGGYVHDIGGVSYLDWIVPGVLASTAFQQAVGESTFSVLGDFKWVRGYHAMRATPVRIADMVAGWLLYIVFRVLLGAIAFLAVSAAFGAIHSAWVVVTPLVCALLGVAVAAPTIAFSARIENDSYFAMLFRFVVIPSTLFAGVFFPVSQLPEAVRALAYASPLWHAVELCRSATLGVAPPWPIWAHLGYLLLWAAGGSLLAYASYRRRLKD